MRSEKLGVACFVPHGGVPIEVPKPYVPGYGGSGVSLFNFRCAEVTVECGHVSGVGLVIVDVENVNCAPFASDLDSCDVVKTRLTLRIFLLHQVRSDAQSSRVRVRSEFGFDIMRGRKDDAASAYMLRPL
jgi:hypothetical protein